MLASRPIQLEPVRYAVTGGQPCGVYGVMRSDFFPPDDWSGLDAPDFLPVGSVRTPQVYDMAITTHTRQGLYK